MAAARREILEGNPLLLRGAEMTALRDTQSEELKRTSDELYEKYGKPLEAEHYGRFLVVSPNGETLLGDTHLEVIQEALARFGPGNFLYKVGPRAVGKFRGRLSKSKLHLKMLVRDGAQ
jgi:hypothetical protein